MSRKNYSRPANLSSAFIEAHRKAFMATPEIDPRMKKGLLGGVLWEVFLSGAWLRGKLVAEGCPDPILLNICFAHGQMSAGRDPWVVARAVLDQYKKGWAPKAGADLAQKILDGEDIPVYQVDGEGGPSDEDGA